MPAILTRREVLAASAALAACDVPTPMPEGPMGPPPVDPQAYDQASVVTFDPAAIAEDATRFPLGVQAGAIRQVSALLWTFASSAQSLKLRVWREIDQVGSVALVKDQDVSTDANGYLKQNVSGLAPATWYRYAFFTDGFAGRTLVGRFRTAYPDNWAEPLTLGATTCTHERNMPFTALEVTAKEPIDAFVHLGDISYNDGAFSREEYRAKWKHTLADPGYRALLSQTGFYPVWDDHEFTNNLDPEKLTATQIENARKAFAETVAIEGGADPLWRSYRWGQTAEIFALDCRAERKLSTATTPDAQYISQAQLDWLVSALQQSPCHFKVVLNSVPITAFNLNYWAIPLDRWQGYPAQREKFLAAIDAVKNVWFLTGDFHMGFVCRIEKEGPRSKMWEVAVGPGGNSGNPLAVLLEPSAGEVDRKAAFPAQQFAYAYGGMAATTLTFDPARDAVRVRYLHHQTGDVQFDQWLSQTT